MIRPLRFSIIAPPTANDPSASACFACSRTTIPAASAVWTRAWPGLAWSRPVRAVRDRAPVIGAETTVTPAAPSRASTARRLICTESDRTVINSRDDSGTLVTSFPSVSAEPCVGDCCFADESRRSGPNRHAHRDPGDSPQVQRPISLPVAHRGAGLLGRCAAVWLPAAVAGSPRWA